MTREFIFMPEFEKKWKHLKFTDTELRDVEACITENPEIGDMMPETGGLRKFRWAKPGNKGKSGGVRILYVDFPHFEKVYMITCFGKDEKVNLNKTEKKTAKTAIGVLKKELRRSHDEKH